MSAPCFAELTAALDWKAIDFISDLHLAPDTPRTFEAWSAHLLHTSADAVFMLGDLFEVWVGDDARHQGFERECMRVLERAASERALAFMVGNRDFLVGAATLNDGGIIALEDPTVLLAFGRRVLLSHGDELCLADVEYQRFREMVRSAAWRHRFLSLPLDERQRIARSLRSASEARMARDEVDVDVDSAMALQWMREAGTPVLVHGHTHRPASELISPGHARHVLSDWDLDHARRAQVLRLGADGFERVAPQDVPAC